MTAVTQWFNPNAESPETPKRKGLYEVKKGNVIWLGSWNGKRFNRFSKPRGTENRDIIFRSILLRIDAWRGLAENPIHSLTLYQAMGCSNA